MELPPLVPDLLKQLRAELSIMREQDRNDAIQEAWVAYLAGEDAVAAAISYRNSEYYNRKRAKQMPDRVGVKTRAYSQLQNRLSDKARRQAPTSAA